MTNWPLNFAVWNTTISALNAWFSCSKSLSGGGAVSHEVINPRALHISMVGSDMELTKASSGHCSGKCSCKNLCQGKGEKVTLVRAKMGLSVQHQQQSSVLLKEALVCVNTCKRACLPAHILYSSAESPVFSLVLLE